MTNKKIRKIRQVLHEIQEAPVVRHQLEALMEKVGAEMPTAGMDSLKDKCIKSVHSLLQMETMMRACVSARWSCMWAAVAAISSFIGLIASWIMVFCQFGR